MSAIAGAALCSCYAYCPHAPLPVLQEAAVRMTAWLAGAHPHVTSSAMSGPDGTRLEQEFDRQATTNGLRSSGVPALLSPFKVRRAGLVG